MATASQNASHNDGGQSTPTQPPIDATPRCPSVGRSWATIAAPSSEDDTLISIRREANFNNTISIDTSQEETVESRIDFIRTQDWRGAGALTNQGLLAGELSSDREHRAGPRGSGGHAHNYLKPGAVIWHYDVRPLHDPSNIPVGWLTFKDENDQQKIKKGRYYVLVERLDSKPGKYEVSEAPIYSNGDTGLQYVSPERHGEYFSLCPEHIHITRFENLSPKNPVLKLDWMRVKPGEESRKLDRTTMVVHWSELQKTDLNAIDIRLVGTLDDASRDILCQRALQKRN